MDQAKRLKLGAIFFSIFWIAGMLWWSGEHPSRQHRHSARSAGSVGGYLWYLAMTWMFQAMHLHPLNGDRGERRDALRFADLCEHETVVTDYTASHVTGRLSSPRNAQPPISTGSRSVEPQALQPRERARQRDVGHHGARGERAGAIMRPGAERDALLGVAGDVEAVRLGKAGLVAVGRAEHEEHAVFRLEVDAAISPRLCDAARRHPDRRDPARIFLEHVDPLCFALAHQRELFGMRQQRPDRACISHRAARSVRPRSQA